MDIKTKKSLVDYFSKFPIKKFKRGETILKSGQDFDGIYFPKKGQIIMYRLSKKKEMQKLPTLEPIFFGSLMNKALERKNEFYFKAVSEVQVWKAPVKETVEFIRSNPSFYFKIIGVAINELMNMCCLTSKLLFGDATQKVALVLVFFADRFGKKTGNQVQFNINLPHKMMANMSGVTRETVTLQLLKFEKEKLIVKKDRKMTIKNLDKLKELAIL